MIRLGNMEVVCTLKLVVVCGLDWQCLWFIIDVGNVAEPKMCMNRPAAPRTLPGGASGQRVKLWCFLRVVPLGCRG